MFTTIISTVIVLGILIFVHELGHFLVAKWSGVTVLRFSLGFGPKLVGITRGDTEYRISAIPLGGYVKMLGEDAEEDVPEHFDPATGFPAQSVWKRIGIVLAGPLSNLVFAIIIFAGIYMFAGIPQITPQIGSVSPGSPAAHAGLKTGDTILAIAGKPITDWNQLSKAIEKQGPHPLTVKFEQQGEVKTVTVTPRVESVKDIFGQMVKRPLIGITASGKFSTKAVNPFYACYYSVVQTGHLCKLFILTIVKLIERVVPLKTLGGPILIAQMAGQEAREGLLNLIYFTALISVNLGILNLLPIPLLDGGHLVFFGIEVAAGKPIEAKKIEMAQRVGLMFLVVLMVFVFYNDIMRLILGHGLSPAP